MGLLLVQAALFLIVPLVGGPHGWTVLSSFSAEIAVDLLGGGESPLDGYDGLAAGPLIWALVEVPWLAVLGAVGLVHVLGGLAMSLGATFCSWLCAREQLGDRPALLVAALMALPPPNLWVHQHYGAYHVIPLVTAPLGLWILLRSEGSLGRRVLGVAVLGSSVAWSYGAVAVAAPLLLWWWGREVSGGRWREATLAGAVGGLLALSPLLWKMGVHVPFDGLMPVGADVAQATKPFFLMAPEPLEIPATLLRMLTRDLSYGWHYGLHGAPGLGVVATAGGLLAALLGMRRAAPWALAALGVVVVGLTTGWFVFHPGAGQPFERDARHVVGLMQALFFLAGGAWAALPEGGAGRAVRWAGGAVVAAMLVASASSQVQDARLGAGFEPLSPFRLESRYVSGFFRGPHFRADPAAGLASCRSEDPLRRADCTRGVAMALGQSGQTVAEVETACSPLPDDLRRWCWFGRGWGAAQRYWRQLEAGARWCAERRIDDRAEGACLSGVGWGAAQDFADRPGVLAGWLDEVDAQERDAVARGIGVYGGMLYRERDHAEAFCARQVPDHLSACRAGFAWNEGFMQPLR